MLNAPVQNKERLETLLFLAIARGEKKLERAVASNGHAEENQINLPSATEAALEILSALTEEDFRVVENRIADFEKNSEEEKAIWRARALSRIHSRSAFLDKDVHFTQIAEVLRGEPPYLQKFILQHLPLEMSAEVAPLFEIETSDEKTAQNVCLNLQNLLRRQFLANFVSREALSEQKPLAFLTGENLLQLMQQLGQREIALVCRGIKDIEDLAPFLRRFDDSDAQSIVEQMANLGAVETGRIMQAEEIVKEAWQSEPESALVTQFVGIFKLAGALAALSDALQVRYTAQKLPVNLAAKLHRRLQILQRKIGERDARTLELIDIFENEVETTAALILLEQVQPKNDSGEKRSVVNLTSVNANVHQNH